MVDQEHVRIQTWIDRFGIDYAKRQANIMIRRYRKATICDCDMYQYRDSMIRSYAALKKFLRTEETNYELEESEVYQEFRKELGIDTGDTALQKSSKAEKEGMEGVAE